MKTALITRIATCLCLGLATAFVQAQSVVPSAPAGINASLLRLFGDVKAFSADAEVQVRNADEKEAARMSAKFHLLNPKLRLEVNLSDLQSQSLPAGAAESLKQVGMDKVISVIRPDLKHSYLIYPGLQSYLELPMKDEDVSPSSTSYRITKKPMGKETIDGHQCIKQRVTVIDANGRSQSATTWEAVDLKGFPIQIQISDGENLLTMRYREIKFAAPQAGLFEIPRAYARYESQEALLQGMMVKIMGGLGSAGQ